VVCLKMRKDLHKALLVLDYNGMDAVRAGSEKRARVLHTPLPKQLVVF
jgi:hypothetical protein